MGFCGDICISNETRCTVSIDPNNFITVGVLVFFKQRMDTYIDEIG